MQRICWLVLGVATTLPGQEVSLLFNVGPGPLYAGERATLWLNVLNAGTADVAWEFPASIPCHVRAPSGTYNAQLQAQAGAQVRQASIHPGTFARTAYLLDFPVETVGQVVLEFPDLNAGAVAIQVNKPPPVGQAQTKGVGTKLRSGIPASPDKAFDPAKFFMEHFAPYEPFYFIAGTESPNAKFQFSFRYQMLSSEAPLAEKAQWLKGFNFAYTQTSLWDWNQASAPFLDSSYKPELLYLWKDAYRNDDSSFRLDIQPGFQHESNGKGGEDSRSVNLTYLRSTLVFGQSDHLQLTLQPRVWGYVGDLSDNPDIARYRGYTDLRGILGWQRGIQLSAIGRMGDHADKGSVQLDLTYPLLRIWSSFSVYLDVQFFTGYGESLLLYDQRSWAVRGGFSLYR